MCLCRSHENYGNSFCIFHKHKRTFRNYNVEHDIITRDAYGVSGAEIWEFSKSQCDIIDAVTI